MNQANDVTKDKLLADVKTVIADAEELMRQTAGQAGDKMADLRAKAQRHIDEAKVSVADAQAAMVDRAKAVGRAADDYVNDNPWRSVGVAAGIGFIVGLLIGRR